MKKTGLILLIFIIFTTGLNVYAEINEDYNIYEVELATPDQLITVNYLVNITNKIFDMITSGFSEEEIKLEYNEEGIKQTALYLAVFFYIASLFKQIDNIEGFTPKVFIKNALFFFFSIWIINNIHYLFDLVDYLRGVLIATFKVKNKKLIDMNVIIMDYYMNMAKADIVSKPKEVMLINNYQQFTILSLVAVVMMATVLYLRLVKIYIYKIIAPIIFAATAFKNTINIVIDFIKEYAFTNLMIVLIVIITNIVLDLGDSYLTSYMMEFFSTTALAIVLIKLQKITMAGMKLGRKGKNFIKKVWNSERKLETAFNLTRGYINRMGYAPIANELPKTVPDYLKRRYYQTAFLSFTKEGRTNFKPSIFKQHVTKFSKLTFEEYREKLNQTGYAPAVNKMPEYLRDRKEKVKGFIKETYGIGKKEEVDV